jgi:hypothetical protein
MPVYESTPAGLRTVTCKLTNGHDRKRQALEEPPIDRLRLFGRSAEPADSSRHAAGDQISNEEKASRSSLAARISLRFRAQLIRYFQADDAPQEDKPQLSKTPGSLGAE